MNYTQEQLEAITAKNRQRVTPARTPEAIRRDQEQANREHERRATRQREQERRACRQDEEERQKAAMWEQIRQQQEQEKKQAEEQREQARRQERIQRALLNARLPLRHLDFAKNPKTNSREWLGAAAAVKPFMGTGALLAFIGSPGNGKTQLGVCLCYRRCQDGGSARFVCAADLFSEIKEAFQTGGASEARQVDQYCSYDLLVIDELQERNGTSWEDKMLTRILNRRYSEKRDTILISNLRLSAFAESIGPSVQDRITEAGLVIEFTWPSFRGQIGAGKLRLLS